MGQKVHPEAMRVGYIHDWKSNWFNEKNFSDFLHEDTLIREHIVRSEPQHEGNAAEYQHDADGGQERADARAQHGGLEAILDRFRIAPALQLLERECLHRLDRIERLVGKPAGIGEPVLGCARQAAHAPPDQDQRRDDRGDHHEDHAHELGAREPEHHEAADETQRGAQNN